jgi:hypothetical protein
MRCLRMALPWASSPLALDDPSLRMTFTLQVWFRHARSTAFDLHLNHKLRLHAVHVWCLLNARGLHG